MSVAGASVPAMNRTDRLYALVEELRAVSPRPLPARRLAQRYEVSIRTIERDVLALQESGVPIYAATGRGGGYVIDKTLTLPPVNFTAAEMAAIAVALAREGDTPFTAASRSALHKVLASAPAAQAAAAARLLDRVRLISPPAAQPPPGIPLALQDAITTGHVLRLDYADRNGAVTVRDVEPVAFAATRSQWYLLAWCRLRDRGRAFRIDRIRGVADTGERAPARSYRELAVDIPDDLVRRPELPR